MSDSETEKRIRSSWDANADAWKSAVRTNGIPSRIAGTNQAIVSTITALGARRVLDAGCGEGWLGRELANVGVDVTGFDASAALIEAARSASGAQFHVLGYDEFAQRPERVGTSFAAVVFNFALLTDDITALLAAAASLLTPAGALVIQTVHPCADADERYEDGWRVETFSAMRDRFTEPMPWYFRTLSSWIAELRQAGLQLTELREPVHPENERPLSLIITASLKRGS